MIKKLSPKSVQQYIDKIYKKGVLYLTGKIKWSISKGSISFML